MLLLALLVVGACAQDADAGQPYPWGDDDDDGDLYDRYNEEVVSSSKAMTPTQESQFTRVRRNDQTTSPVRTLSPDEIREVKGVLSKMMAGRDLKGFTLESVTDFKRLMDLMSSPSPTLMSDLAHFTPSSTQRTLQDNSIMPLRSKLSDKHEEIIYGGMIFKRVRNTYVVLPSKVYPIADIPMKRNERDTACLRHCLDAYGCKAATVNRYNSECNIYRNTWEEEGVHSYTDNRYTYFVIVGPAPATTGEPDNSTTTEEYTTQPLIIDIRKLVQIIANLTMNTIESNLTELFNATLQKYGIPMCGETTTTEEPTYDFANATIVSKCFVCGLEDLGIPRNAYCADAFAGDFLPLVPIDPRAKGQVASYRKYCRYLDVPGTLVNETQPRSVFGRWTGGCSVRWIDLSGVFTQRACRNRRHAVMGKHYVSKRMAKLEMALKNEDNGCIISPMASLVPLSRSISLYARFHACVCTGNWCNGVPLAHPPVRIYYALAVMQTMLIII